MKQNRWNSKIVWMSITAVLVLLMNNYGLWGFIGMEETVFTELVNIILGILVMVGVLNNPTDKQEF
jgi:uncharacterized membrane protein